MAFISDVHSNLEALEAVLGETEGLELICLGDIVGYGSNPNEVIQRLKDANTVAVLGNHDDAVLTGDTSWFNTRAAVAAGWTADHLAEDSRLYLSGLPLQVKTEFEGVRVYLTHGSPDDNLREYVELETHEDQFSRYLTRLQVGAIGLGHTHRPFVWKSESGIVFNPGSAGQPRDGDPRASYAVATFEEGRAAVDVRRVEYDTAKAASKIIKAGLPESLASRLFEGR